MKCPMPGGLEEGNVQQCRWNSCFVEDMSTEFLQIDILYALSVSASDALLACLSISLNAHFLRSLLVFTNQALDCDHLYAVTLSIFQIDITPVLKLFV